MMDASSYLQFLISGLTVGSTYGLTALGFTIIFNTTGVINFAQGEFVMLGGMLSVVFSGLGLPLILAVPAAVACTCLAGLAFERLAIRPVHDAEVLRLIIITIGVGILIRGLTMLIWGKDTFALPHFSASRPSTCSGPPCCPRACGCWPSRSRSLRGSRPSSRAPCSARACWPASTTPRPRPCPV
jgi:branched-chain amino acid transport system permease protein